MRVGDVVSVPEVRTVIRLSDARDRTLSEDMVRAFVPTAEAARALETILTDLETGRPRGFFIQGNYGSGKSHLLGLLSLLIERPDLWSHLSRDTGLPMPETLSSLKDDLAGRRFLVAGLSLVDHSGHESLEGMVWEAVSREIGGEGLPRRADTTFVDDLLPVLRERYGEELSEFLSAEGETLDGPPERVASLLESFMVRRGLPYRARFDRSGALDALRSSVAASGLDGVVLLVDEMSEFLRSKPDARSFSEDVRFLQFLAERADNVPLWVVITLQEAIESTGELKTDTLRKIKDRYAAPFVLGGTHIRQLIAHRLIRRKPGADSAVRSLMDDVASSFPSFATRGLGDTYPVHPDTVEMLDSLKVLFSQHRGVVDFIHYQLRGDSSRDIAPLLDQPYETLLTPDRIYDHFRHRIRENPETAPFHDRVEAFYAREITGLFDDPGDGATALRLIKILILAAICPAETRFTVRRLAEMTLERLSALDPEVNYQYVGGLLERMHRDGAYLATDEGESGSSLDRAYYIDLEADVQLLVKSRLDLAAREVELDDGRIWSRLGPRVSDPHLPLAEWLAAPDQETASVWQRTRRRGRWLAGEPSAVGDEGMRHLTGEAAAEDLDFMLYVVTSLHDRERRFIERLELSGRWADVSVFWLPRRPSEEESDLLRRALAAVLLEEGLTEDRTTTGERMREHLEELTSDLSGRAARVFRDLFFGGSMLLAGGETVADPSGWDYLRPEEMRSRLVEVVLNRRHPRHRQVSPRSESLLGHGVSAAWEHLIRPGCMKIGADRSAEKTAADFLVPMGLARRLSSEIRIEADASQNPLIEIVTGLVTDGRSSMTEIYAELRSGPFGLSREAFHLLMLVVIAVGLATPYRSGRRVSLDQVSPGRIDSIDALAPGETLSERHAAVLATCPLLPPRLRQDQLTYPVQRAAWAHLTENKRQWEARIKSALARLRDLADYRLLSSHDLDGVARDGGMVLEVLGQIKTSYDSREGLERLAAAYGENPGFDAAWDRVRGWTTFIEERVERAVFMYDYLTGAAPRFAGDDELDPVRVGAEEIEQARTRALQALAGEPALTDAGQFDRLGRSFDLFRASYSRFYADEHERQLGAARFEPYRHLAGSRPYRALSLLSQIETVSVPNDLVRIDRALHGISQSHCSNLTADVLHRRPTCGCGFAIGHQLSLPPVRDLWTIVEEGVREYVQELGRPAIRERLTAYMAGLEETGRRKSTEPLRKLLSVDSSDPEAMRQVADLVTGPVIKMINEALAGKSVVVDRNLNELYESLVGRVFSQDRLMAVVAGWIAGDGEPDPSSYIRVSGGAEPEEIRERGESRPFPGADRGEASPGPPATD